ncbi:hypothetical protein M378DRAFT_16404 [Amanita muscaria Koide BX008]|uniref:Hydrophobin n=1 Tax=Amanita muscaria (strain Koide BX008) TaxID=946122 RepID=A0A0C2S3H4_AMAMK|nr:hypothetical protein M378DRAFT_16404 [Amanita muscaria Koide BX008]
MQLSRFLLFALPALAIAAVIPDSRTDKCYSGSLLCCGKMADPSRPDGVDPDDRNPSDNSQGKTGSQCFPIELIVGGLENPCAAAEVCCVSYDPDKLIGYSCVENFNSPS